MSKVRANVAAYERTKARAILQSSANSAAARDIGAIPPVADHDRKQSALAHLRTFCESYFPKRFSLKWSPDHLKVLAIIEEAVFHGGLFAFAMPRGSGKTTICEVAVIWVLLTGIHRFVYLIGASEEHAKRLLTNLQTELATNELLAADFPEVLYPIRCLEGQTRRAAGQLHFGQLTRITWSESEIVLPTIPGSRAAGSIVQVAGITGNIRGAIHVTAEGISIRPTFAMIDDPQTDGSARSPSQCYSREQTISKAVLNLPGPGKAITAVMPCTIISKGDMADQMLDRESHPDWQGQKTKMVYKFPENQALWDKYAQIRRASLRAGNRGREATQFYAKHRAQMDEGAEVAWQERHEPDELSGLQHAMNLKLRDEVAFQSEYQNDPPDDQGRSAMELTAAQIMDKLNGLDSTTVPLAANRITAYIDVQGQILFWTVVAWADDFTGAVIEYGTEPEQRARLFTLSDIRNTLQAVHGLSSLEARLYKGMTVLTDRILGRDWIREDGVALRITRALVDANWGESTDVIYQFCRQTTHRAVLSPSHGRYIGPSARPMAEYTPQRGEQAGLNWLIPATGGRRACRYVLYDTNYWKSAVAQRLATPIADPGSLTLYGRNPERHRLLADHLTAEYRIQTSGRGRTVDEWKLKGPGRDNHWLDCIVGSAVAASILGVSPPGIEAPKKPKSRRMSEVYAEKKARLRSA